MSFGKYDFAFLDAAYDIANDIHLEKRITMHDNVDDEVIPDPESFLLFEDCLDEQGFIIEGKLLEKIKTICENKSVTAALYAVFVTEGMAGICHLFLSGYD